MSKRWIFAVIVAAAAAATDINRSSSNRRHRRLRYLRRCFNWNCRLGILSSFILQSFCNHFAIGDYRRCVTEMKEWRSHTLAIQSGPRSHASCSKPSSHTAIRYQQSRGTLREETSYRLPINKACDFIPLSIWLTGVAKTFPKSPQPVQWVRHAYTLLGQRMCIDN